MNYSSPFRRRGGFTLVELLVVIAIITILMGLVLGAGPAVREAQRRTAAKNTCLQIESALNAYYTDYGKFPPVSTTAQEESRTPGDTIVGDPAMNVPQPNNVLMDTLRDIPRGVNANGAANPRHTVYFQTTVAALSGGKPVNGFYDRTSNGSLPPQTDAGCFFDPWGKQFGIVIDTSGDERIDLAPVYTDFGGADPISGKAPRRRAGAFAMGKDGGLGTDGDRSYRKGTTASDDVASWE